MGLDEVDTEKSKESRLRQPAELELIHCHCQEHVKIKNPE